MYYSEPSLKMGFENGDKILKVDGKTQKDFDKLSLDVLLSDHITVLRNGKEVTFPTSDSGKALVLQADTPKAFLMPRIAPTVDTVVQKSTLDAGLKIGDKIVSVDNQKIEYYDELAPIVSQKAGSKVDFVVERGQTLVPVSVPVDKEGKIGVASYKDYKKMVTLHHFSLTESVGRGYTRTIESLTYQVKQFKLIFNKTIKGYKKVGGPIAIVNNMHVDKTKDGDLSINWQQFWSFTAKFSIWLAFLNLIPIPGLDGGHVLFTLWEIITRKPVPQKILENAQMVGVIFLLGLMVLIFGNDIVKLIVQALS